MDTKENKFKNLHAVIMAGGVGSRFWPYSRNQKPKQFLDVLNCGSSLLQLTYQRLTAIIPSNNIWVVSHVDYSKLVRDQLPEINSNRILLEPHRKNTAACIMYASLHIHEVDPDSLVFIAPSDHLILNTNEFNDAVIKSASFIVSQSDALLTFGIKASRPDTGYGYIRFQRNADTFGVCPVEQFVEKPDSAKARSYLDSGNYVWNSGMFLWKNATILKMMQQFAPDVYVCFNSYKPGDVLDDIYDRCPSISIDYAVMEKTDKAFVLPVDFGWSDLGTWASLYELQEKDTNGNVNTGSQILLRDTNNCLVRNEENKIIAIQGVEHLIIVNTPEALLICDKSQEQAIKQMVSELQVQFGNSVL